MSPIGLAWAWWEYIERLNLRCYYTRLELKRKGAKP